MDANRTTVLAIRQAVVHFSIAVCVLVPRVAIAQGLTGALIGTVQDDQGAVLPGASVRITSAALIGGVAQVITNEKGQLRFLALPPGSYDLDIEFHGLTTYHEADIRIGAGATTDRTVRLTLAGLAESIVVEGAGPRLDARDPGFGTRFGSEDLNAIPTRRSSMFDFIRAAPGISPTSPSSGTTTTVSAFGSGTNENLFLIDGTNTTCPCNGIARAEPGIDFIQEVHVQSIGASVEFGNMQGAVISVITKQGSNRFLYDAAYYGQTAGLTSQPVRLSYGEWETGYKRTKYGDATTNLGGPAVRDRLWFFAGYQYLRDYDSQPGTDPAYPRTYEQDKIFAKLTWKLTPRLQLVQSLHEEFWVNPDPPTLVTPFEATRRRSASVPAMTFGHLTHTSSGNTVWEVRVGRFVYSEEREPSTGDRTTPSRLDRVTGVTTGAPSQFGGLKLMRTSGKATINHFRPGLFRADHQWKTGGEIERGEQRGANVIPTGVRFEDRNGLPSQAISSEPSNTGGAFVTVAAFASDAITLGDGLTINVGTRFDQSRAISQDLRNLDGAGHETDGVINGLGTLYVWNVVSPRLGVTAKLSADGRTMLRGSYGRFNQGVHTGEFSGFHPGVTPITTLAFDPLTRDYTRFVRRVDPRVNLQLDPEMRAPHTDELSIGMDREIGNRLAVSIAYVNKRASDSIGWMDVGGRYREESRTLPDGHVVPVFVLLNSTSEQRFLLTNPEEYSMTYNGLVTAVEKRWSRGWQMFGSYTVSRTYGLQASSGTTAAGPQANTVAAPSMPFGRDPNDLTNARGRMPNDRPHIFRAMGAAKVPRTGVVIASNLQYFSGKPWAATAQIGLPQGDQRVLIEPRGTRRLSSQTLLDVRFTRTIRVGRNRSVELLLDVLNVLNDASGEGLASDDLFSPNFGQPTVFMDPRRAMIGARLNLGR